MVFMTTFPTLPSCFDNFSVTLHENHDNMNTVELHHLSIGYKVKNTWRVVVEDINASLEEGRMTCLIGPNGVGKSTLLRTLSAFQPKIGGEILLQGKDLSQYTEKQLARLIGVVLTEKPDVQNMSVREIVGLGRSPYTGFWGTLNDDDWQAVDQALQQVGITDLSRRMIQTLSDGERQKVMIAKALAQQTPIIYLDEPTAFLDFPSKVETMQLLRRLALEEQKTIFLSTHDVELSLQLADKIWLMEPGHLSVGTPRQLADEGALSRFIDHDGITFDKESLTIHITK